MKKFFIIISVPLVLAILMYVFNPFGTATLDPRARILGVVPYVMPSGSMEPTLKAGEYFLVDATAYMNTIPAINDVIVFKYPENRDIKYVKRVVARGGETVSMIKGDVIVDGKAIEQPYLDEDKTVISKANDFGPLPVPAGMLFVLGDYRDNSRDSRYWGYVPVDDVVGKVTRIWYSEDEERIGQVN
ncbi:MAG: signal peptidase I [Thioalkalispiraceae bacterium]|jgi:signal peptidase I